MNNAIKYNAIEMSKYAYITCIVTYQRKNHFQ